VLPNAFVKYQTCKTKQTVSDIDYKQSLHILSLKVQLTHAKLRKKPYTDAYPKKP